MDENVGDRLITKYYHVVCVCRKRSPQVGRGEERLGRAWWPFGTLINLCRTDGIWHALWVLNIYC